MLDCSSWTKARKNGNGDFKQNYVAHEKKKTKKKPLRRELFKKGPEVNFPEAYYKI